MDQSPSALFESYASDLSQLLQSITSQLEGTTPSGEPLKALIRKSEADLDEGEEILSQMEVELPSIPQSIRSKYTTSFKVHKAQLDKTKKLIKSAKQSSSRSALLSSSNGSPLDPSLSDNPYSDSPDQSTQRTRLLQGTERLQDGTRRLEESHRLALETENVGGDILSNLRRQREQIEHSRDVLVQADSSIDRASGTLKNMIWRMYQQKFMTYGIIAILVLLIVIVVYSKVHG